MARPRLKHAETLERRDRIYRMFLTGMSETEIAGQAGITQQSVSEHIANALNSKTPKSRRQAYAALVQEIADSTRQTKSRAYMIFLAAVNNKNGSLQLGALSRIQASDAILASLVPDLEALSQWEQIDEVREAIYEKRQADKILLSGRRVPAETTP